MGEELRSVLDTLDGAGRVRVLGWMASPEWTRPPLVSDTAIHDAVRPWQVLLQEIGSGVELTAAGYLRPSLVEQLAERTGVTDWWIGKANREDLTPPIAHLRTTARALGLVTVRKGRLLPTRVGRACAHRPVDLWNHVLSRLPLGRGEFERSAGWFALLAAASGQPAEDWWGATSDLLAEAGWVAPRGQRPSAHSPTLQVLDVLAAGLRHWTATGHNAAATAAARTVVLG